MGKGSDRNAFGKTFLAISGKVLLTHEPPKTKESRRVSTSPFSMRSDTIVGTLI
jgi:hypothetical protein